MSNTEIIVEDDDGAVVSYSPSSTWIYRQSPDYHGRSYHLSSASGACATFTFNGSYVAYYCELSPAGGQFSVRLDGQTVFSSSSYSDPPLRQRLRFETAVDPGIHALSIVNDDRESGSVVGVDYFVEELRPSQPYYANCAR
ncbi:hypothetical protein AURDEDRAFT_164272 [Auricularia subglabra TFB-10046 SS5]|nr:hypothetical protein AURDEDRAFT_164272 [Auricularia subglabra TFB-10046 SS5]